MERWYRLWLSFLARGILKLFNRAVCRRKKLINITGWWLVNICRSYFPNCGYMLCIASKGSRLHVRKQQSRNYLLNQNESRLWMKPLSFQTCSADNTACSWTGRPSYSTCVHGGWIQQLRERDKENIFLIWIMWVDDGRNSFIQRFGCCEEWFHFHSQSCLTSFSGHSPGRQHCVCRAQLCQAKGELLSHF